MQINLIFPDGTTTYSVPSRTDSLEEARFDVASSFHRICILCGAPATAKKEPERTFQDSEGDTKREKRPQLNTHITTSYGQVRTKRSQIKGVLKEGRREANILLV